VLGGKRAPFKQHIVLLGILCDVGRITGNIVHELLTKFSNDLALDHRVIDVVSCG